MEAAIMDTAISTRLRHYDLKDAMAAKDPRFGYALGRLLLSGTINTDQHAAGLRYAEVMASYHGLTGIPFPSARAQNLFAVRGDSGDTSEEHAEAARKARAKMIVLRDLLLKCGDIDTGRRVEQAVKSVCLLDELRTINAPTRVWLVRGLNALHRHYGGTQ